ncbi:Crp/Fnr family transcriptional regulator [Thiocystis violascens]|uniref:cAMP-binding protein n=1 Tax=Thiocystis violascens (strain ATCC 17096 / DSM 198 / 6111) TaxID=765911 RepID=I3Y6Z0_THIV6|nr:Crp/Fnr family transcriptional regulator [Thiocystis violascens]AFL72758.1 cAMP-binding protein [Thiocystis violascens DSM 198]
MIQDSSQQRRLIERFAFLRDGGEALRETFFAQAKVATLPAEHIICRDGGQCSQLALVLAGTGRVYKLGENGREITLYRIEAGQSCVVTASCILSQRPFPAFAVCETEVEAAVVAQGDVQRWLTSSSHWRDFIFAQVAERIGEVFSVLDAVLFQPLDQRLAALLLHRARRSPKGAARGRILRVTHQELAVELGSSREVITRLLRDFEKTGALLTGRGQIELLDPSILEAR